MGDRQLGITDAQFGEFLSRGIAFSNSPGVAFEYSNLGFALLGRVVSIVAGVPTNATSPAKFSCPSA